MPNCASDVPVSPLSLLICGTLAAFRQKLHLSTCPNLASQLCPSVCVVTVIQPARDRPVRVLREDVLHVSVGVVAVVRGLPIAIQRVHKLAESVVGVSGD